MQVATFLSTLNYSTIYLKLKTAFCSTACRCSYDSCIKWLFLSTLL